MREHLALAPGGGFHGGTDPSRAVAKSEATASKSTFVPSRTVSVDQAAGHLRRNTRESDRNRGGKSLFTEQGRPGSHPKLGPRPLMSTSSGHMI